MLSRKKTKFRGFTGGVRPEEKLNINFSVINVELFMKEKGVLHMEKHVINANYVIISLRCVNQK